MSITISTDVFCDGADCSQWVEGVTGPRTRAEDARKEAKRKGWWISRHGDFCPECVLEMEIQHEAITHLGKDQ